MGTTKSFRFECLEISFNGGCAHLHYIKGVTLEKIPADVRFFYAKCGELEFKLFGEITDIATPGGEGQLGSPVTNLTIELEADVSAKYQPE